LAKPFNIPKQLVMQAYRLVKANRGAPGVDHESMSAFEEKLKDNLYKIWNRLSSGSYMPPPVKEVPIPKKDGGVRILGVPTIGDRIAQMVVKLIFEPQVEPHFLSDSYGYRPRKSALDAVGVTRERCRRWNWVLEFDIRGLFDNIPHDLLLKAVRKHTDERWILLYIERWLRAPMQSPEGTLRERTRGTPQGGVISPVLANLFLHYVFDAWMKREFSSILWCRYADDGLLHCKSEAQAQYLRTALERRFAECGLELHPDKTKIVYCKDDRRRGVYPTTQFDFLGYTFRARLVVLRRERRSFVSFSPAVSNAAMKSMRAKVRQFRIRRWSGLSLQDIAELLNPILRGWIQYYGQFRRSELYRVFRYDNLTMVAWAVKKFKRFRRSKVRASRFLIQVAEREPNLFAHWSCGMVGMFI
jgi:group II intron reverse transcriptase/maturase